jgi:hypothetical protein
LKWDIRLQFRKSDLLKFELFHFVCLYNFIKIIIKYYKEIYIFLFAKCKIYFLKINLNLENLVHFYIKLFSFLVITVLHEEIMIECGKIHIN